MRDRLLGYALIVSIIAHLLIFTALGRGSAERLVDDELKIVQVEILRPSEELAPEVLPEPEPIPEPEIIPPPERVPTQARRPEPEPVRRPDPAPPADVRTEPAPAVRNEDPRPSPTPRERPPRVPESNGRATDPVVGTPDPRPPAPPPPPPPPPDVDVRVCARSGMLPGELCENAAVRKFRPGAEPSARCNVCKPKHVSTLADRSTPELVSGARQPTYPTSAKIRGIEGSVTVEFTINTEGRVVSVRVTSSSGNRDLDQAAIDTVSGRRYNPAVQAGIPRNYRMRETFRFTLN